MKKKKKKKKKKKEKRKKKRKRTERKERKEKKKEEKGFNANTELDHLNEDLHIDAGEVVGEESEREWEERRYCFLFFFSSSSSLDVFQLNSSLRHSRDSERRRVIKGLRVNKRRNERAENLS